MISLERLPQAVDRYTVGGEQPVHLFNLVCQALVGEVSAGEWAALPFSSWTLLPRLVDVEGVGPLLYTAFQAAGQSAPANAWNLLSAQYYNTAAQNTLLLEALGEILSAFHAAGVRAILLKGAGLVAARLPGMAQPVYLDPALRPMVDLDLLVHWEARSAALAELERLGYVNAEPEAAPGLAEDTLHAAYLRGGPGARVGVELHWNLIAGRSDQRTASADWFWAQAAPALLNPLVSAGRFPPPAGWALNPTAQLLYLAGHQGLRHPDDLRLLWLYDMHTLVTQAGLLMDWGALAVQAQALGWGGALAAVFGQVQACFGTPFPPAFLAGLPAPRLHTNPLRRPTRTQETWWALLRLDRKDRTRAALALAFPSTAYMRWRYHLGTAAGRPAWLLPFTYLYRWADLAADLLRTLAHSLWRKLRPPQDTP